MFIISWIFASILIAFVAADKKIGFGRALILSLLFSPIIGYLMLLTFGDR